MSEKEDWSTFRSIVRTALTPILSRIGQHPPQITGQKPQESDKHFVLDYTRTLNYFQEEHRWGDHETKVFNEFIDELLRSGYKIEVAEFFREEADRVRRAHCEARLAIIKAKRK